MADILALGAHPDDIELGAGGTVASLLARGDNVTLCDLTNGEPTPHGSPEIRAAETESSNAILGVKDRLNLGMPNRWLRDSEEGRKKIAEVYRRVRPDVVLIPYPEDAHPDHVEASAMARAARFIAKYTKTEMEGEPFYPPQVFYYLCVHLRKQLDPTLIFDISDFAEKKFRAIRAYHSQFYAGGRERGDFLLRKLESQAAWYGSLIGAKYGEPLIKLEEVGIKSFDGLLP